MLVVAVCEVVFAKLLFEVMMLMGYCYSSGVGDGIRFVVVMSNNSIIFDCVSVSSDNNSGINSILVLIIVRVVLVLCTAI
jgi:hypothetical protein